MGRADSFDRFCIPASRVPIHHNQRFYIADTGIMLSEGEDDFKSPLEELAKRNLSYKEYDPVTFDVQKVRPADFASQITLKDLPVFRAITPEELSDCGWTEKQKRRIAPNVMAFTDRFNDVCLWTQREILATERSSRRSQIVSHFIKVAKKLLDLNNVHSAFAIVSALQCQSIFRLEKTWLNVGRSDKSSLSKMKRLFDSENNWERLRDYVDSQKLPCIPYLGLYLTDLNFLHVSQKKKEHFFAARPQEYMKNNIIRLLAHFQDSRYDHLITIPCLQKYLDSVSIHSELVRAAEEELYKQSLVREPTSPVGSFSRRSSLSRLSGFIGLRSSAKSTTTPRLDDSITKTNKSKSLTPQLPLSSMRRAHRKTQSVGEAGYFGARGIENTAFVDSGLPPLESCDGSKPSDADKNESTQLIDIVEEKWHLEDEMSALCSPAKAKFFVKRWRKKKE